MSGNSVVPSGFVYRGNIRNLSDNALQTLRNGYSKMMAIRDQRGYNFIAGIHGVPQFMCVHGQSARWMSENMRLFLPWHRAYLYTFEQFFKDQIDGAMGIPWWDWASSESRNNGIPDSFKQPKIDNKDNPLFSTRIRSLFPEEDRLLIRDPLNVGAMYARIDRYAEDNIPEATDNPSGVEGGNLLERLVAIPDFGDFSDKLQMVHNIIHNYAGGDRGDLRSPNWAAFDHFFGLIILWLIEFGGFGN